MRRMREVRRTAHTTPKVGLEDVVRIGVNASIEEKHSMSKTTAANAVWPKPCALVSSNPSQFVIACDPCPTRRSTLSACVRASA